MANYNADIRVGITGKTQLNALERQLGRINKDLNKINKGLKAQTLTINTKGATRALDQLDQKIRQLSRNVNIGINEKSSNKSQRGGNTTVVSAPREAKQQADGIAAAYAQQRKLKDSQREQLKIQKQINPLIEQQAKLQAEISTQVEKIRKNRAGAQNATNLKNQGAQLNRLNFGYDALLRKLNRLRGEYKGVANEVRGLEKASISASEQQLIAAEKRKQRLNDLRLQKNGGRYPKGLRSGGAKGALASGSLALSSIPGLGGAASGALIGGGVGGAAGAVAGAAVGAITELVGATAQYANAAAKAAAEQEKFNTALRGITSGSDYQKALEDISELSEQFIQDIGTTTEQFTKLTAATTANGISVDETAEVYRGLAAANLALGGNAERLQGILLATGQVFSKGKVQAEELRGQIGERLPGAFALFAKSVGKTPAELDKALEKGEVTVEDFVKFTKSLFEQYGENAKIIRDGPANAGARLEKALGDLQRSVGALLAPIGAAFQDTFTAIAKAINVAIEALNRFLGIGTENALAKTNRQIEDVASRLDNVKGNRKQKLNEQLTRLLAEQKRLKDLQKGTAEAPTKPVSSTTDSSGSGSSSSSGPRDKTAELRAELALEQALLEIQRQRSGLRGVEAQLFEFELQKKEREKELENELKQIQTENITADSKALATQVAKVRAARELEEINEAQKIFKEDQLKAFEDQLADLETEIAIEEAVTEQKREQLRLEQEIRKIRGNDELTDEQKNKLIQGQKKLQEARDGNQGISGYMKQLQEELLDTEAMIVSLAQTVQTELANAMSTAITGLLDGTKTAQEAFADMFKSIGKAFINMAMEIIAKQLVMIALQSVLKSLGGGAFGIGASAPKIGTDTNYFSGGFTPMDFFSGRANGGPVQANQPYIVGEREPELFVPNTPGTIYNQDQMASAMSRFSGGGSEQAAGGPITIDVSTTSINGMEFITPEQFKKGTEDAAARGAKMGEQRAMSRLRNSRSTRSNLGI